MAQGIFLIQDFIIILVLINGITSLHHGLRTLETPIPESLLKPRNFNPHPYEQYRTSSITLNTIDTYPLDYIGDNSILNVSPSVASPLTDEQVKHPGNGIYSQGPVQFPPSAPATRLNNIQNLPHPYQQLKLQGQLARPNDRSRLTEFDEDDSLSSLVKKHYAFSYTVKDKYSGDDFSHSEQQNNGAVKGTYKVHLPDGRTQIVRYTADNDGYRAEVSYIGAASTNEALGDGRSAKAFLPTVNSGHTAPGYAEITSSATKLALDQQAIQHTPIFPLNTYNLQTDKSQRVAGNLYANLNPLDYNQANLYASSIANQQHINSPLAPLPTSQSNIFVSTAKPPYVVSLRKTVPYPIVGGGAYVISPKSTQVQASAHNYDHYSNYKYGNAESEVSVQLNTGTGQNGPNLQQGTILFQK